jgi:hypothetical protein
MERRSRDDPRDGRAPPWASRGVRPETTGPVVPTPRERILQEDGETIEVAAPSSEARQPSIDLTGSLIEGVVASIEATGSSGERREPSIEATWPSIETTLRSIEASLHSIEATWHSIDENYSSIDMACSLSGPNCTCGVETFSFSPEKHSSIDTTQYFCRRKVHSIESADTLVRKRCSIVDEKRYLTCTIDSFSKAKWQSIETK